MTREAPVLPFSTAELLSQQAWLRNLAATLVRDQAERDDLVQEAWLAALRTPGLEGKRDLRQWLGAVLRNRWRSERRSDARRRAREHGRAELELVPAAADLVERAELQGVLVRAVLALEEPYRSTVLQRYFGERTCRAIARAEGVPEGTVRSRLKRALDQLRAELDRSSGGERRAWVLALVPLARLARGRQALASFAAVAAAAIAVLALGWAWIGRTERISTDLSAATTESTPAMGLDPAVQEPLRRAPLSVETADASRSSALVASARLELLVLDPENQPVAGASVVCGADERKQTLRTDERGTCRVPDQSWAESWLEVSIDAAGFVHDDSSIARGTFSWSSPFPITLRRAVALEGRLHDADTGQPIEGGVLTMLDVRLHRLGGSHGRILDRSTSGHDGSFRLEPAPRGCEVGLLVTAPAHAPTRRLIQVANAERAFVELALDPGIELHGRVVDALTGVPLSGVSVFHGADAFGYPVSPDENSIELLRSDAHGELVLRIPRDQEPLDLTLSRTGYCCQAANPRADGFEVALVPSAWIQGTVRDGEGNSIEDAEVTQSTSRSSSIQPPSDPALARLARARQLPRTSQTRSDGAGRFLLEILPWCPGYQIGHRIPGRKLELLRIDDPLQPGETREFEIRLEPAGTIAGLLRINGEPGPGRVRCRAQGKEVEAWTRPDGRFELRGVPPGRVAMQAFPDEFERNEGGAVRPILAEVEVAAGQTKSIDLDLALPLGTIRGRVTSPSGKPRAHVKVWATAGRGFGYWRTVTDAAGYFELHVPSEYARYDLSAQDGPPVAVSPDAEEIEIVRAGTGHVRVRVEDAASRTVIEGAILFVRRSTTQWDRWGALPAGTNGFVQWEREAGALELAAGKPDAGYPAAYVGKFMLDEDGELELEPRLEHVSPVQFVLTNPPLPEGCGILLETLSGLPMVDEDSSHFLSLSEGPASLPGLASGDYRISSSLSDVVVEPAQIRLGADRSKPIEITWHRK